MRASVYTRISTDLQDAGMQKRELLQFANERGFEIVEIYEDVKSGGTTNRPALQRMLADARAKKFDVCLSYKFDRIARSLKDLIGLFTELEGAGVKVISVRDNVDMTTSAGKLMFHMIGAFAEFERSIIRERVVSGLRNAKAKGKILGRPVSINHASVVSEWNSGKHPKQIALDMNIGLRTVYSIVAKNRKTG